MNVFFLVVYVLITFLYCWCNWGGGELDPYWNIWIHLGKSATKQTLEPTQKRPSDPECMNEIGSLYTQEMNYL